MKKRLNEQNFEQLNELIRKVASTIHPDGDDWHYLYHKDIRDRLYDTKPACFISLKRSDGGPMGREVGEYILPVCNRAGHEDPRVIEISIKVIKKLMASEKGMFDINDLKVILGKLQHKHDVYSKPIPKPPAAAAKKALATKLFNKIRGHLRREY